ncbi:aldo/keto reductase [Leptolinea tardivitalis]|uniref:Aldo/keto reductase n=1 Tax=Leptolinea tardivitalis TaxID=229920 RepID=A0A0P6WX52_9CHLR|nr:aldo/keto reductase [Leptolinea tardivitalis]KPL73312.1 aldo/keto reductase [Leptolinea tardivitalis]GAP21444.1 predicted oxidoreductase [Leptolinea tardivitalis]
MITDFTRTLGRSGIEVSPMGMGCWAIGGPWKFNGVPAGWSQVDDAESERAIRRAFDLGVTYFDTAANYGAGHSERLLGNVFKDRRDQVVISTKFGYIVDERNKEVRHYDEAEEHSHVAEHLKQDVEASLIRLDTDYIDVYFLHVWGLDIDLALEAREVLEDLVRQGKIRTYGWSTDRPDAIKAFATSSNCSAVQQQLSVLDGNMELLALCEEQNLASVNRGPLGMGLLTGKFAPDTTFASDDVRRYANWHPGFQDGKPTQDWLNKLASIREVLTSGGRTLSQGALAWIWAKSEKTVPIPGFKNTAQVEENCKAMQFGPLSSDQMKEIDQILGR